jgi:hypothetical protein
MCVIMLVNGTRPTEAMIDAAWKTNPDGAGIAWREGKGDRTEVVWEKGIMQIDRIKELCATAPQPYVVHFRVASCGGVKESLTHPFVVDLGVPLELTGRTKGAVLFHNGHWGAWTDKVMEAAIHSNNRLPAGSDWSDTRGMAYMVAIYGPNVLEMLPSQKGVVMTPTEFNVFTGNGFEKINNVWCSNDYFWGGSRNRSHTNHTGSGSHNTGGFYGKLCSRGHCTNRAMINKDVCWECEKKGSEVKTETVSSVGQSQNNDKTTALAIVSGGVENGPLGQAFSLDQVINFYKAKLVSKSTLKKYRKAHGNSLQKGKAGERAQKTLCRLSMEMAERLVAGLPN